MHLNDFLAERLERTGVALADWRELLVRLMNYGVICRDESQTERELYDRYVRVEDLTRETLSLFGLELYHDRRFEYIRVYPPGARLPGMDDAEHEAFGGSLRARPSQAEVALILVLRVQYDKALREGKVDENGYVAESFESLGIAMKNLLGRALPDKLTERKALFRRIKQLRLISYGADEELDNGEAWLRIHPMIVDFVNPDAVAALTAGEPVELADADADVEEGESAHVS